MEANYGDFRNLYFPHIRTIDYLSDLDFSYCDFRDSLISQSIANSFFDDALLVGTSFTLRLDSISFRNTDLRKTKFIGNTPYTYLLLYNAIVSTDSFKALVNAGVTQFHLVDLSAVDFQRVLKQNSYKLDFALSSLVGADLSLLNLQEVKLVQANLRNANLRGSILTKSYITGITIEGAQLNLEEFYFFAKNGHKIFKNCLIFSLINFEEYPSVFLNKINFQHTHNLLDF